MKTNMTITVTQEVIDAAMPRDSSHCVSSDAIRDTNPHLKHISTDLQSIRFSDPHTGERYLCITPPKIQRMLVDWDQGIKPEPFKFRLPVPAIAVPIGAGNGGKRKPPTVRKNPNGSYETHGHVPTVVTDKLPPTGRTGRSFGLRGLDR